MYFHQKKSTGYPGFCTEQGSAVAATASSYKKWKIVSGAQNTGEMVAFTPVRKMNDGGNSFILFSDAEPCKMEDLVEKACALFFQDGKII